jgi:hypothetical protein
MRALIVHDKAGEIQWLAIQDSEIEGELGLEVAKDESVLEIELGAVDDDGESRSQRAQRTADELVRGFKVDVAKKKLVARKKP